MPRMKEMAGMLFVGAMIGTILAFYWLIDPTLG